MKDNKDILDGLQKSAKPDLPTGFFDQFWKDLVQRIESESGVLGQLKKSNKPEVPTNFFENLSAQLIEQENTSIIEGLEKQERPKLPSNYFAQSADSIMATIDENTKESSSTGRIINMRAIRLISLVAATIAIIFTVIHFSGNSNADEIAVEDPQKQFIDTETSTDDSYEEYLAYFDEAELINYIIDNDIAIEDTTEAIDFEEYYDYSEEELEEYYLDLL